VVPVVPRGALPITPSPQGWRIVALLLTSDAMARFEAAKSCA
jgi:hypothetical protein